MNQLTPAERLATIMRTMRELVIPLLPELQRQGKEVDLGKLMDIIARYTSVEELRDFISTGGPVPPLQTGQSPSERPLQSPVTTRNTVRRSVPGASRSGKDDVMARILSGAGVQGSEGATVTRPTG